MHATLDIHGQKLRTKTNCRYVVVAYRAEDLTVFNERTGTNERFVAFARVDRRSDSLEKAIKIRNETGSVRFGVRADVYDTTTGNVVGR